jgi:two-component system chemotaxis response regulator CheY
MKKALIVDDAEANRIVIGAIISKFGVAVDYAEDGDEAVQKFAATIPDIVFIDQIMPRKNGSDAIKQMKLIVPDFIAILMSALTNAEDIKVIVETCGANEFLPKPISYTVIGEVLKKYNIIE